MIYMLLAFFPLLRHGIAADESYKLDEQRAREWSTSEVSIWKLPRKLREHQHLSSASLVYSVFEVEASHIYGDITYPVGIRCIIDVRAEV